MRSVARANMKAAGFEKLNKKRMLRGKDDQPKKRSAFGALWRDYVGKDTLYKQTQEKKKRKLAAIKKALGRKKAGAAS